MSTMVFSNKPHFLLLIILFLFIAPLISGCAVAVPVGVSMGAGAVYLSKDRSPIRVTENAGDVAGCSFIKHVEATSGWGGLLMQDRALEKTISDLTHDSTDAGANVLLVRSKRKAFSGSSSTGDAYLCPGTGNSSTSSKVEAADTGAHQ